MQDGDGVVHDRALPLAAARLPDGDAGSGVGQLAGARPEGAVDEREAEQIGFGLAGATRGHGEGRRWAGEVVVMAAPCRAPLVAGLRATWSPAQPVGGPC